MESKMKSRKTKTATKKMCVNDANFNNVLKYLKAMHKAAENKKTRSDDLPSTLQVEKEYLNALRKAVGQLIDPETAEVNWWYVETFDPYGDHKYLPAHLHCIGGAHFARAPETDVWIESADLPKATYNRLREIHG
jgi:hypothetical protein